ncbi:MAG: flippase [Clostridia bacterium]
MSENKSLKVNFIFNVVLSLTSLVFPLITFPYVSRVLQPAGLGKVSFATSVISYFSIFAQLGIPTYGIRACSKVKDDTDRLSKTILEILFINLVTVSISYISLFFSLVYVDKFRDYRTLIIIVSCSIMLNAIGVEWLYKALEQYSYITIRSIVFKVIAILLMFLLVKNQDDYNIYGAISIFAASASNVLNFINLRKYIKVKKNMLCCLSIKKHLKPILVFFLMSVATTIYTQLDTVMLGFMKDDTIVGYYNVATKIKSVLCGIVSAFGAVILPRASYFIEKKMIKEFQSVTIRTVEFITFFSIPICLFFVFNSKESIIFLSGKEYIATEPAMNILMPTVILIGFTNLFSMQMLIPQGKEKINLLASVSGLLVNMIANCLLIPRYDIIGASLATLLAEFVVFVIEFIFLKKLLIKAFQKVKWITLLSAIILSLIAMNLVKKAVMNFPTILILCACACTFFGIYIVVLIILKEPLVYENYYKLQEKLKTKK